jgi:hypothetical protein
VVIFVFAARLAVHYLEQDMVVQSVKEYTTRYINARLSNWIEDQGGWVSEYVLYSLSYKSNA